MELKYSIQGLLVYSAFAAYILAFSAAVLTLKKTARTLYFAAFLVTAAAFAYRWYDVAHVPFQNMFEVFLTMALLVWPLSLFCKTKLRVGCETADMLFAAILLLPVGFFFHAQPQKLPPALQNWLFIPHVAVYLAAYVIMAKAAVQALCSLKTPAPPPALKLTDYEQGTYRMICFGFPLLTLGLILGSFWGKLAWGDYWGWDPKESWSLASWLVYLEYLHFRYLHAKKHPAANALLAVLAFAVIIITLLWVNLSQIFIGLHNYAA